LNTIEGFLMQAVESIRDGQEERKKNNPETALKIDEFLVKLQNCVDGNQDFTFIIDDPAGNSFVENLFAPQADPNMKTTHYKRTVEQNWAIGLATDENKEEEVAQDIRNKVKTNNKDYLYKLDFDEFDYKKQVMSFPGNCSNCHTPCETRMFALDIPYFKEVIVMATTCDVCDYKSSEVKGGGAISDKGRRITLKVTSPEDMSRDILKSETASCEIPEKELHLGRGTLGGRFTTVEGLLAGIKDDLLKSNPFVSGDSGEQGVRMKFKRFLDDLEELMSGKIPFTIILEDPVANSYIQSLCAPDPDPSLTVEDYERTFEQNEELGLNDIKVENYEENNK